MTTGRNVSVNVAVPTTGRKPTKYAVQLRKDGTLVTSRLARVSGGKVVASVTAKETGTHTLTVVALFTDGSKRVWNGPNLTLGS
jgi:hypothetical protein